MFDPISTYRIQFHKGFTFADLQTALPYLQKLGVKTIYASPIFKAVPGSMHGYDVTDPLQVNPEIGTLQQLRDISSRLKSAEMGWIQDIVPNHMAFHTDNKWLVDVLENGRNSRYASYFDIDWDHSASREKLMVPILGKTPDEAIASKELSVVDDGGKMRLKYFDTLLPLTSDPKDTNPELLNNDAGALKELLDKQRYQLCHWQRTDTHINYRRFFTINGLISLNMQNDAVFCDYHSLIKELCDQNIFQGLRVDHVDGLADPEKYLHDLRKMAGLDKYIIVEKILEPHEQLPPNWPVAGTTGYDFLADVNGLLTNKKGIKKLRKLYESLTRKKKSYEKLLLEKKALILDRYMQGDLDNLCQLFYSLNLADEKRLKRTSKADVRSALRSFLIFCPVYAYYGNKLPLSEEETNDVKTILEKVKAKEPKLDTAVDIITDVLLTTPKEGLSEYNKRAVKFYQRLMQFTGPLMAKGGEDTAMYVYNSLLSHNEVGDMPGTKGLDTNDFHNKMIARQESWPYALNATATHDTKRGEDARARLNVLTDLHEEWEKTAKHWMRLNGSIKQRGIPAVNDEYFIYQALLASYPIPGTPDDSFKERFKAYIQKAFREAKIHTDWANPNKEYEAGVEHFIDGLFNSNTEFNKDFHIFVKKIADTGTVNSLVQLVLKFCCPGVPDTYQGTELWDLSMVDPDNRRPVDYELRARLLDELIANTDAAQLWEQRNTGQIKLWLTSHLLRLRSEAPEAFTGGNYQPLKVVGKYKRHIIAFARVHTEQRYIVVLPLNIAQLAKEQECAIANIDWEDTAVEIADNLPIQWASRFSGEVLKATRIPVKELFEPLPLAILEASGNGRSAGILMPIFSLESEFGVGDFGPGLRKFADFLHAAGQTYWQLLPLTPVNKESAYSPYNSVSSMAGNILYISPEQLVADGLLDERRLKEFHLPYHKHVDYALAKKNKRAICDLAYENFCKNDETRLAYTFKEFCRTEAHWLDDYALFVLLKEEFEGKQWNEWPELYKKRDEHTLSQYQAKNDAAINKVKWVQFIIADQWRKARQYCNNKGIKVFGDLPFYLSYDSVDVWAHPEMFCLDEAGNMSGIAGVPPDYFSKTGQLWNMPTYNWKVMKQNNYEWWLRRLRKNLELFDVLRLDHFRAFEAYWQVPAGEETAVNGEWLKGPGMDFFNTVKKHLGLPFIAEDLGDHMDDVYRLREETGLPGMKVLQFAWGENSPVSVDIPHNYPLNCIVYTGTHDNNTSLGWYKEEMKPQDGKRLERYTGAAIKEKNVCLVLSRLAYASVARIAILPMQDILQLDSENRINTPGTAQHNWRWRMRKGALTTAVRKELAGLARRYNRL
ncbi:MAG: malto-oligosyltrehalose synthase [Bacteroidetes bacterium]|nr:malto-oligosyltrehalose synthase [Bacteroidota bacterium]